MNEKVYISGKMTGLEREEYRDRFREAERLIRAEGYHRIVNPIRVWTCRVPWLYKAIGYKLTLLYDLWLVLRCDRIYMIPGWNDSRGAKIESFVAYNSGIRRLPQKVKDRLDAKMEQFISKVDDRDWERVSKVKGWRYRQVVKPNKDEG